MRHVRITPVVEHPISSLGHYHCEGPRCKGRHEERSTAYALAFPCEGIFVKRDANGEGVADSTGCALFNPGQPYEVDHPAAVPDHCWFVTLENSFFDDAWDHFEQRDAFLEGRGFPTPVVALEPGDWLRLQGIYRALRDAADELAFEETLYELLALVLARVFGREKPGDSPSGNHDRVRAAQAWLAEQFREPVKLREVAAATGTSPYHLARLFRRVTGRSIHGHLTDLRLRAALEALKNVGQPVTAIALDLGFSSHSHFTSKFTTAFGLTPSAYRAGFA